MTKKSEMVRRSKVVKWVKKRLETHEQLEKAKADPQWQAAQMSLLISLMAEFQIDTEELGE